MSEPLYVGGWGFSTSIGAAWQAAYAWQFLKALRLCRLRQRKTHRRINRTSLACLPVELMAIIEAEVVKRELVRAMQKIPPSSCQCPLFRTFYGLPRTRKAFHEWCSSGPDYECWLDRSRDEPCAECWHDFSMTEIHDKLWNEFIDLHAGQCQDFGARKTFWTMLLHACQEDFDFPHHGPVRSHCTIPYQWTHR